VAPNSNHPEDDDLEALQLPPSEITNHQLYVLLVRMNARMTAQNIVIGQLRHEVQDQADAMVEMSAAWESASGVLKFVKIMGAVAASCTALWGLVKLAMLKN
jgi:hypothetical protein